MKERPILFSGPMVRAILEGRKTQTRRVLRVPDHPAVLDWVMDSDGRATARAASEEVARQFVTTFPHGRVLCPYGLPGDRLWVRETHRPRVSRSGVERGVQYRADDATRWASGAGTFYNAVTGMIPLELWAPSRHAEFSSHCDRWRPSIHMPRWACRLTLEVVSVRVERLQEISEADAIAEGVQTHAQFYAAEYKKDGTKPPETIQGSVPWYRYDGEACAATSARHSFQTLWESINGPGSWALNPWVWVVEFKRVEVPNG